MKHKLWLAIGLLVVCISSFASLSIAQKIIVITAADPPGPEDQTLIDHIETMGFDVEAHSTAEPQPVDTSSAAAVVIGEKLSSGDVTDAYKDASIPVVITETYVLDDMGLATDGTFNEAEDDTIVIVDSAHPIAGGLTGEVKIATEAHDVCATSDIQGDAHVIANVKASGHTALATYEKGAKDMDGAPLPERRVFVFLFADLIPVLTDDGWGLVERSIQWALGMTTAVTPEDTVSKTWGALKMSCR